jgi:hypothetical protein
MPRSDLDQLRRLSHRPEGAIAADALSSPVRQDGTNMLAVQQSNQLTA